MYMNVSWLYVQCSKGDSWWPWNILIFLVKRETSGYLSKSDIQLFIIRFFVSEYSLKSVRVSLLQPLN